jgi:hypothetical protein
VGSGGLGCELPLSHVDEAAVSRPLDTGSTLFKGAGEPACPSLGNVCPQLARSYFLTPVVGEKMFLSKGRERLPEAK